MFLLRNFYLEKLKNLLLDIGNSTIKIGIGSVANGSTVKLYKRFDYDKKSFSKDLKNNFPSQLYKNDISKVGISVLNKENHAKLNIFFKDRFEIKPIFISSKIRLPVEIDYSRSLGNDRICSACAASQEHRYRNILVVDFGTATTFTLIVNKTIKGGLISPGIATSMKSLFQNTDLPNVRKPSFPPKLIANNSFDNIRSGVMYGALFSCERIIKELSKQYRNLFVIFTGGFSNAIFGKTNLADKIDRLLVIKGINYILNYESDHKGNN